MAVVETGVPVWALDDARLDGPLGLRGARAGERLGEGEYAADLRPGACVVADAAGPVAVLFGDVAPEPPPRSRTARGCGCSPSRCPGCRRCTSRRRCSAAPRRFRTPVAPQ